MELHVLRGWEVGQFKFLNGGPLYLFGEYQLFWPMVIYFKLTGSCCPPLRPRLSGCWDDKPILFLDDTVAGKSMMQAMQHMRGTGPGQSPMQFRMQSRSLAYVSILRKRHPSFIPSNFAEFGDGVVLPTDREMLEADFKWWVEAAAPWDKVLRVMSEAPGGVGHMPCCYSCTPMGCVTARLGKCPYRHDPEWKEAVEDLQAVQRFCAACRKHASSNRCARCRRVFYCGRACQKAHWKGYKAVCEEVVATTTAITMNG